MACERNTHACLGRLGDSGLDVGGVHTYKHKDARLHAVSFTLSMKRTVTIGPEYGKGAKICTNKFELGPPGPGVKKGRRGDGGERGTFSGLARAWFGGGLV